MTVTYEHFVIFVGLVPTLVALFRLIIYLKYMRESSSQQVTRSFDTSTSNVSKVVTNELFPRS